MEVSYSYVPRNGGLYEKTMPISDAVSRLKMLDENEAKTAYYAPTDSGTTRFNDKAEADAIRAALGSKAADIRAAIGAMGVAI